MTIHQVLFPYSAIVGQEDFKLALALNLVDHSIGGVLALGDKGTGKTTIVRSLSQLMANADPDFSFVNLPIGASEDRVLGAVNLEKLINEKRQEVQKGLLTQANGGILYIDEINLLNDYLTDVLLDAAATGSYYLEREGLSLWQPSRFCLVGTMNPEEGELRPQLLDRFGLCVDIETPTALPMRKVIAKRRTLFDQDTEAFYQEFLEKEKRVQEEILSAKARVRDIETDDDLYEYACNLGIEYQVEGMRADILLIKAGKAYAALQGKNQLSQEDIDKVAPLVLRHRSKNPPKSNSGENDQSPPPEQDKNSNRDIANEHPPEKDRDEQPEKDQRDEVQHFQKQFTDQSLRFFKKKVDKTSRKGQETPANDDKIRSGPTNRPVQEIDYRQSVKNFVVKEKFEVTYKTHEARSKVAIYFLVDSSGSMARYQQISFVKGVINNTIAGNKGKHVAFATVGLINGSAQIIQAETRNTGQLLQKLEDFRTGGRTNLTHGFQQINYLLKENKNRGKHHELFILTDGRINTGSDKNIDPLEEAASYYRRHLKKIHVVKVIDMEKGFVKLGKAAELARKIKAGYQALNERN